MAESPGRHLPGLLSWYLEQNLALYQMGVERLLASCTWVQILQTIHSFSKYLLSCYRPVSVLGTGDSAVKKILPFKELGA